MKGVPRSYQPTVLPRPTENTSRLRPGDRRNPPLRRIVSRSSAQVHTEPSYQSPVIRGVPSGAAVTIVDSSATVVPADVALLTSAAVFSSSSQTVPAGSVVYVMGQMPGGIVVAYSSASGEVQGIVPQEQLERLGGRLEEWAQLDPRSGGGWIPVRFLEPFEHSR